MTQQRRRVALAAAWLAIAALVSLGAAGIIGAMAHLPGTPARAELTYEGDKAIETGLASAEKGLVDLAGEVRQLSDLGRRALTSLVSRDIETLVSSVADGESLTLTIELRAAELRRELASLPGIAEDNELVLSPQSRERQDRVLQALAATDGLVAAWSSLGVGSVAATRMTVLLTNHDETTAAAAALGQTGKYAEALDKLTESDAIIDDARGLGEQLGNSEVDVTTLNQWLDLNAEYDAALRSLYVAVIASNGDPTPEVQQAFDAEAAARRRLPADTRGLVVILAEIGRGGLNQAVIGIEEARGKLDAAVGLLGP